MFLNALNDISINSEIDEKFKSHGGYKSSLFRFSSAEVAYHDSRLLLFENRKRISENLKFTFSVQLEGADGNHIVDFNYEHDRFLPHRINVIIGKNGTGKTQFLVALINALSGLKHTNGFQPTNPLFGKVIAISYSLFDNFPKPPTTTVFNYKYIGLRDKDEELISDEILEDKIKGCIKCYY